MFVRTNFVAMTPAILMAGEGRLQANWVAPVGSTDDL
jgi:hypothetical protein